MATSQVNLLNPYGEPETLDAAEVPKALQLGYTQPSAEQVQAFQDEGQSGGFGQGVGAAVEGALSGATLGGSRYLERATGIASAEEQASRKRQHPYASGIGEFGGVLGASALVGPEIAAAEEAGAPVALGAADLANPIGAIAKIGHNVREAVGPGISEALGVSGEASPLVQRALSRASTLAVGSAVEGAAFGLGNAVDESALGDPDALGEKLAAHVGYGALFGGGLGGALGTGAEVIPAATRKLIGLVPGESLIKKVLSTFGGVSEENITAYLADKSGVNAAPEVEDLYNHYASHVQGVIDDFTDKKVTKEIAEKEMKSLRSGLLKDAGTDKKAAADRLAQATVQFDRDSQLQALHAAPGVVDSMQNLRKEAIAGSQGALGLLDQVDGEIPLKRLYDKASELQFGLKERADPASLQRAEAIGDYVKSIQTTYGDTAPARNVKRIIQGLDDYSNFNKNAATFDRGLSPLYGTLRHELDDTLKVAVPEYKEAMLPVAGKFKLLNELGSKYGEEDSARRAINSLKSQVNYQNEMGLLRNLEKEGGGNFVRQIDQYADPTLRDIFQKSIPEYAEAQKMAEVHRVLTDPRSQEIIEAELQKNPDYQKAKDALAAFDAAKAAKADLGGVTPNNLESKINAAMRGKFNAEKILAEFPEFQGKNVADLLKVMRIKQAFERGAMNGSRHVNMYAAAIGALMGAAGGVGGALGGAGAGGAIGGYMDKHGPQVVKTILDAYADNSLHIARLAQIERSAQTVTRAINQGAKSIFIRETGPKKEQKPIDHNSVFEDLRANVGNPEASMVKMARNAAAIQQTAPNVSSSLQRTSAAAASFLSSKIPSGGPPHPLSRPYQPSKSEIGKFNRYYGAIVDPAGVLEQVKHASISPEAMEALQTVHPKMLQEMRQAVMDQLTTEISKKNPTGFTPTAVLPYNKKISLSMFLGQDLDSSLSQPALFANQLSWSTPGAAQAQNDYNQRVKTSEKGLSAINLSAQMQTPMQKAARRNERGE